MKRMILGVGVTLVGLLLVAGLVSGEIPHLINFQGRLTDSSGNPLNGSYSITLGIYSVPSGGTALWTETQAGVTVSNGIFNVLLGSVTEIPATLFEEEDRYLGIKVGTNSEMTPRQRITSVGYAFSADRVKGSNIFPSSGNVGIGTTDPQGKLHVTDGSTNIIKARSSGIIDFPKQSSCKAYLTSGVTLLHDTFNVVPFDTEEYDFQNEFNTSTHRFTATEPGVYRIYVTLFIEIIPPTKTRVALLIYKNGGVLVNYHYPETEPYGVNVTAEDTVQLASGDYIYIVCYPYFFNASLSGTSFLAVTKVM